MLDKEMNDYLFDILKNGDHLKKNFPMDLFASYYGNS